MTDINTILTLVTRIVCGLCVALFCIAAIFLYVKRQSIKRGIKNVENGDVNDNDKVNDVLNDYKATCKGKDYTTEYASDYINLDSVAGAYGLNLKWVNAVPNILTGLGILGTFLGLSIAVKGFDSSSSEGIQDSINTLLSGMSTAFFTSVFGMLFSLIFLFIERIVSNDITIKIDRFCSKLDSEYHCSVDYAVIRSFSYQDEEGNQFSPSESLQLVQEDVKNMRSQLANFGTDIFDGIGNALDTSFQERLVPILKELSNKLENPAQAVTDGLIKELKTVCDDFSNNVTKDVNAKMDDLLEKFIDASNTIATLPDTVDGINKSLCSSTKDTVLATQAVSETIDKQILRLNNLSDTFADTLDKLSGISSNITELHAKLESMPGALSEASAAIAMSAAEIKESQQGVGETLQNIKDINIGTSRVVAEYASNINSIQEGLSSIFAEITNGLSQYSDSVKKSLQDMLNPFTSSVTDATEKVANAIAPLNDAVSDLSGFNDSVRKILSEVEASFKPVETVLRQLADIKQKAASEIGNNTRPKA